MYNVVPGRSNPVMSGSSVDQLPPNTPCSTRFVDGFLRGSLFGLAWGLTVDRVDREICREAAGKTKGTLLNLGVGIAQMMVGFGVFVGTFHGAACACRQFRSKNDWINQAAGGAAAGALVGLRTRSLPACILWATLTASAAAAVEIRWNGNDDEDSELR